MVTADVFEILRAGVTLARNRQIQKVSQLKELLLEMYPGRQAEINEAVTLWAQCARRTRSA